MLRHWFQHRNARSVPYQCCALLDGVAPGIALKAKRELPEGQVSVVSKLSHSASRQTYRRWRCGTILPCQPRA